MKNKSPGLAKALKMSILKKRKRIKNIGVGNISKNSVSPIYAFYYRSKTASEQYPIILLLDRGTVDKVRFKYPPFQPHSIKPRIVKRGGKKKRAYTKVLPPRPIRSKAKGDTYIAGILLDTLSPTILEVLITKYKGLPVLPLSEAKKITGFTTQKYRIYDTRKIRDLSILDPEDVLISLLEE